MADWRQQVDLVGFSPAKINLFLHILGRRADGYHQLQTAFQFLDFGDELGFSLRDDGIVELMTPMPGNLIWEQNLIYRAALILQSHTRCGLGVNIYLHKRMPMGGGLGGGSANAALTLMALNQLWALDLSKATLMQLGLQLGADVPVFVFGQSAWAEGVGEQLSAISLPTPFYVVLVPACFVATGEVFSSTELTRDTPPAKMCPLLQRNVTSGRYLIFGHNDCEAVVRRRYLAVDHAMLCLADYAEPRLTGTGACVFAAFADERAARQVLACLQPEFNGFVARGMNQIAPPCDAVTRE